MKQHFLGLLAVVVAMGAVGLHFWERPVKIAYAETSVLMSQFTESIKAQKEFEESKKEWDKNKKTISDSLNTAMDRLKLGYEKASKLQKELMRQDLDKWNTDLNRYNQAVVKMSEEKQKQLLEPVVDKMNSYLKQWGHEHGYDFIFGTLSGGNILHANISFNITSDFLKDLNEHYKDFQSAPKDSAHSK